MIEQTKAKTSNACLPSTPLLMCCSVGFLAQGPLLMPYFVISTCPNQDLTLHIPGGG